MPPAILINKKEKPLILFLLPLWKLKENTLVLAATVLITQGQENYQGNK